MDEESAVAGGCLGCITGHRAVVVQPAHTAICLLLRCRLVQKEFSGSSGYWGLLRRVPVFGWEDCRPTSASPVSLSLHMQPLCAQQTVLGCACLHIGSMP